MSVTSTIAITILAALLATAAVAQDAGLPRDRTVRAPIAAGDEANLLPLPGFLALFVRPPSPQQRFLAENGLGALHARNRYGTAVTCVGNEDCTGVTPMPVSPKDRAILTQRGIKALPPGRPVFLKVPESE